MPSALGATSVVRMAPPSSAQRRRCRGVAPEVRGAAGEVQRRVQRSGG